VNWSLGNFLKSLIGDKPGQCDLVVAQAELAYNSSMNRSMGKSSFQVVYGRSPKDVVDLVNLPEVKDRSVDANRFAKSIHDIHE
jgi:hypothetical protein